MTPHGLPLAWYWASPWMLGFLAAVAVPWILHLWSRRSYESTPWAAMDLLAAAIRQSRRRLHVTHWLLLALRTAVVIGVVCAAAEPRPDHFASAGPAARAVHRILVLDASYSMRYERAGTTAFARAKATSREIILRSQPRDTVSLVLMTQSPRVVFSFAKADAATLEQIDALRCKDTTIAAVATCGVVERLLDQASMLYSRGVVQEVYFLTDMRRAGWAPPPSSAARDQGPDLARLRSAIAALRERAGLTFVNVTDSNGPTPENVAVTDLRADRHAAVQGVPIRFTASIRLFGQTGRTRYPIQWLVDGRPVARQELDIPPDGTVLSTHTHSFADSGASIVEVRLPADPLPVDNRRWHVIDVRPRLNVLVVEPPFTPSSASSSAAHLLAAALEPKGVATQASSAFRVDRLRDGQLADHPLTAYDCIIFCDVPRFTRDEVQRLRTYLRAGGGAVFFLGPHVAIADYNDKLFASDPEGAIGPILPARLGQIEDNTEYRIDLLDYQHPIVAPFRGHERSGLLTTPVDRYVRLEPAPASRVLARLPSGAPLAVEHEVASGRVVLFATSADTSWAPMPLWPSFVPLVHETVLHASQGRFSGRNLRVGQPLRSDAVARSTDVMEVTLPDGQTRPAARGTQPASEAPCFVDTWWAGIYGLHPRRDTPPPPDESVTDVATMASQWESASHRAVFAVNVDTTESDPASFSLATFRTAVLGDGDAFVVWASDLASSPRRATSARLGNPWVRVILLIVFVLIGMETLVAHLSEAGALPPARAARLRSLGKERGI